MKYASYLLCALTLAIVGGARGDLKLPAILASKMVLQRDHAVPIWGHADPGEQIAVHFAEQSKATMADAKGNWRVSLDAMPAGGPFQLTVAGKGNTVKLDDVLVGEVWLCSGQSNMDFMLNKSATATEAIAAADRPTLRIFKVDREEAPEPKDDCTGKWEQSASDNVGTFSAVAYYFGCHLQNELKVPVGLIQSSVGGTPAEAWTSRKTLEADPEFASILSRADDERKSMPDVRQKFDAQLDEWKKATAEAKSIGSPLPRRPFTPAALQPGKYPYELYNGMIAPLAPFSIRGIIWYQGEGNAIRAFQYRKLLPAMIRDWRSLWGDDSIPFGIVQLPNFGKTQTEPVEDSAWAELRESQLMASRSTPNVGMVTIIDLGENDNIHPIKKREVGDRLALWALAKVYGHDIACSGPLYQGMKVEGNQIRISFEFAQGGLKATDGGDIKGFAIAGKDHKFVDANVRVDGNGILVSSGKITEPVAVRYAWAGSPICNLTNGTGLPASPFRTDDWPGMTDDRH